MEAVAEQKETAVRFIAIKDVIIPPDYTRKVKSTDKEIKELAESIKGTNGIINAIIVRPDPSHASDGKFELISGRRRLMASLLAGFDAIKAEVVNVDDRMAGIINVTENLQREDLSPLDEAESLQKLIAAGKDSKEISESLGKTESWVVRRSKLLELIPEWQDAMKYDGPNVYHNPLSCFINWSIGHFELIARYPEEEQRAIFEELSENHYSVNDSTISQLEKFLDGRMMLISKAPWKLDDESLYPDAGSCTECQKRSCHQAILFQGDLSPEAIGKNDKCLDGGCWKQKSQLYLEGQISQHRKKHPNLVKISNSGFYNGNEGVIPSYEYTKAKKSDKNAVPAIVVDGPGYGKLKYVKLTSSGRSTSSSAAKSSKDMNPEAKLKAKKEQRKKRVYAKILTEIRSKLYNMAPDDSGEPKCSSLKQFEGLVDSKERIMALAVVFGTKDNSTYCAKDEWKEWEDLTDQEAGEIHQQLWEAMIGVFADRLNYQQPSNIDDLRVEEAKRVCRLIGLDFKGLEEAAEASVPVPKSWAKEEAAIAHMKEQKAKKSKKVKTSKKNSKKKASKKKKETPEQES